VPSQRSGAAACHRLRFFTPDRHRRGETVAERPGRHQAEESWRRIRGRLRGELGNTTFERWIESVELGEADGARVALNVPTRFLRDWVAPRYGDRLRALWQSERPETKAIDIVVRPELKEGSPPQAAETVAAEVAGEGGAETDAGTGDPFAEAEGIGAILDSRYSFDNFVVGKPNEFAHAAARRVAESDDVPFNPLFIYGGVGLGKTHLMHAIALGVRARRPGRRVI
jgi:chromosomal replication initiator protein